MISNVYALAQQADVRDPDSSTSPGGEWLLNVSYAAHELGLDHTVGDLHDAVRELADSLVPVYTHHLWSVFTDLCLWEEEEINDFAGDDADMTKRAQVACYLVATRLALHCAEEAGR